MDRSRIYDGIDPKLTTLERVAEIRRRERAWDEAHPKTATDVPKGKSWFRCFLDGFKNSGYIAPQKPPCVYIEDDDDDPGTTAWYT